MDSVTTNIKTGYSIPIKTICSWLRLLRTKTGNSDIEHALRSAKFIELTDEEKGTFATIKNIYLSEMNGDLSPSPSMREILLNIEEFESQDD